MLLKLKDAASFAGLTVVAVIALLLAFTPFLIDRGFLTLPQSLQASVVLTIVAVICFAVEKIRNSQDDGDREKQDATRDTLLKHLSEDLKEVKQALGTLTPQKAAQLDQAHTLYSALEQTANKPPSEVASLLQAGVREAASKQIYVWKDITSMLNKDFTGSEKDVVAVRSIADSLIRSSLDRPKNNGEK
jgi:hypothetical protein